MAESCDDDPSYDRIIDAFKKHYDKLITTMGPCVMEVARVLYQERLISKETVGAAHEVSMSEQVRSFKVVNAVEVYITTCKSSSKSLEILSILEKHPPLNVLVDNILQDAGLTCRSSRSNGEFHSHYQNHVLVQVFYCLPAIENDANKSNESPAARPKLKSETLVCV